MSITITYNPPPGDDRAVTYFDVEFFAGRPETLDPADHPDLARKVVKNPLFKVTGVADEATAPSDEDGEEPDVAPRRRGRPPKVKPDGEDTP